MIAYRDAIAAARRLIGTPYAQLDCINLIKRVIRTAPGGVSGYTTAGTNALWKSYTMSAKYRDLTWRQEGISGARAGMLVFKRSGEDVHHVGLVTGDGTVIHSSVNGRGVVETPLTQKEGWNLLAKHRYIDTAAEAAESEADMESYMAQVILKNPGSALNVRNEPGTGGDVIGTLTHGELVTVQAEMDNGWRYVSANGVSGYVDGRYLAYVTEIQEDTVEADAADTITIIDGAGNTFTPVGSFRVLIGGVD